MNKNSLNNLIKKSNLDNTDYYVYNKSRTIKKEDNAKYNITTYPNFNNYIVLNIEEINSTSEDKEIIYISALKIINNNIDSKLESYIKPKNPIPPHALKKLSSINLENTSSLESFLNILTLFIRDLPLVIYNISSIINLINITKTLGQEITNSILDLKYLLKQTYNLKRHSLSYLSKHFNIDSKDKTYITYTLYKNLQENNHFLKNML